ncbi:MAG: superoxide dismutase family protein, partial [Alphaproteobacteria bacterium]
DTDGLSFLVHANLDDHVSQPIGGAGARIACGVFQPAN